MIEGTKAIIAVVACLFFAIFAKRYSDMKKKALENQKRDLENEKKAAILQNDSTDLVDLVERENKRRGTDNNS